MYVTEDVTNSYHQARAASAGLIETLKAQTAGLVNHLAQQGITRSYERADPIAARRVMDNQLGIRQMQQEQQRRALDNNIGSTLQAEYLPHRVMENGAQTASKAQTAQNLAGTLQTGTHTPIASGNQSDFGNHLARISGLQAGGMSLGQALAHVAGDTLTTYQPSSHEEMKAKIERQYGTSGAHFPMNGAWNPR